MFLLTEMKYHLLRGRGRSVLMVCIAALLLGVMGFYLGNIQINQAALGNLAEQIPVPITVTSRDGSKRSELNIYAVNFDKLVSSHVEHVVCTAEAAGAFSEEARSADPFTGGDTSIQAANCFEGFGLSEELFSFAEGYGPSLFEGTENLCVVNESFAQEHGIEEGEEFSLEMRTAFRAVPNELTESAQLDGANAFTILWKILVPVCMPTIAVLVLYYAVGHWNSWFNASIYLQDSTKYPMQLVMKKILDSANVSEMVGDIGGADKARYVELIKYALIVVSTFPIMVVYPFLQKYFVKGVMVGSVKG